MITLVQTQILRDGDFYKSLISPRRVDHWDVAHGKLSVSMTLTCMVSSLFVAHG